MTGCIASSINNDGTIVGVLTGDGIHPFLLKDGVFTLLNDVLEPGTPWTIQWAKSINDAG
ncbi:MAG: hypothetical protein SGJ09_04830 [Phycisphaerae bacterium]|nr:hypothetical protein [Phycisphaerae bacterium]